MAFHDLICRMPSLLLKAHHKCLKATWVLEKGVHLLVRLTLSTGDMNRCVETKEDRVTFLKGKNKNLKSHLSKSHLSLDLA